jgi:MFS superfamily sulfate permease-like transporter
MLVGVVLIGLAQLRMGFVSRFIAAGVQVGFMFGLGLTIIVGQLPDLLGVPAGDGDVFAQAGRLLSRLGDVNPWTAAIGLTSLAALLGARRVAAAVPAALVVVVSRIVVVALGDLTAAGVDVIGEIDGAVPLRPFRRWAWRSWSGCCRGRWPWPSSAPSRAPPWPSPCGRRHQRRDRPRPPLPRRRGRGADASA